MGAFCFINRLTNRGLNLIICNIAVPYGSPKCLKQTSINLRWSRTRFQGSRPVAIKRPRTSELTPWPDASYDARWLRRSSSPLRHPKSAHSYSPWNTLSRTTASPVLPKHLLPVPIRLLLEVPVLPPRCRLGWLPYLPGLPLHRPHGGLSL